MDIKIKKLCPDAVIPTYAHNTDAAMDVTATSITVTDDYIEYGTGLAFEVPEDYLMLIFPRSSNSKKDLLLANSVGVLDAGYRGELKLRFKRNYRISNYPREETNYKSTTSSIVNYGAAENYQWDASNWYDVGERIGQIMIIPRPKINFKEVDELTETERGDGSFGSTGK